LAGLALSLASGSALGQAGKYPSKQITIVVGYAAGGSVDTVARVVAESLRKKWGHPVIVENRAGAAGNVAAGQVARADPDGYTLLYTATSTAINVFRYENPGYSLQDLAPISISTPSTTVIAVNANNSVRNVEDLIKAYRGKGIVVGTSGAGSAGYIVGEYFFRELMKIEPVMTPFRSGTGSVSALIGDHVQAVSVAISDAFGPISSGKVRALVMAGTERSPKMPNVPTLAEAGFPDFSAYGWAAMFAPAKTDEKIQDQLNAAVNEALGDPENRKRLEALGFSVNVQPLEETRKRFARDVSSWGRMLKGTKKIH
jgi:tripartite-type tricarboxylate transporter receptor subunit TctC